MTALAQSEGRALKVRRKRQGSVQITWAWWTRVVRVRVGRRASMVVVVDGFSLCLPFSFFFENLSGLDEGPPLSKLCMS